MKAQWARLVKLIASHLEPEGTALKRLQQEGWNGLNGETHLGDAIAKLTKESDAATLAAIKKANLNKDLTLGRYTIPGQELALLRVEMFGRNAGEDAMSIVEAMSKDAGSFPQRAAVALDSAAFVKVAKAGEFPGVNEGTELSQAMINTLEGLKNAEVQGAKTKFVVSPQQWKLEPDGKTWKAVGATETPMSREKTAMIMSGIIVGTVGGGILLMSIVGWSRNASGQAVVG